MWFSNRFIALTLSATGSGRASFNREPQQQRICVFLKRVCGDRPEKILQRALVFFYVILGFSLTGREAIGTIFMGKCSHVSIHGDSAFKAC